MPAILTAWVRVLGLGACAAVVACADQGGAKALELKSDAKLESGIGALWKGGGSVLLTSLTDFDWDGVVFYPEGTLASVIHTDLGQPVLGDQKYFTNARNLFVFRLQGKPVRLVLSSADLFANADYGRVFGRGLTLTAKAPGVGLLTLSQR